MIQRLALPALFAALALAACGAEEPAPPASPPPAEPTAPAPAPAAPAGKVPLLTLEGEGLRLVDPDSGSARPLPFGAPKDQAIAAVALAMGGAPDDQGRNDDCGAGALEFASWEKGLTLWFQEGAFVGWGGVADLTTASGIGRGSTRAELLSAYDAKIEQSTLGEEFSAGGLSGVLESAAPDAQIAELWAGATCIAR